MKFVRARKGIPLKSFKEHHNPWNAAGVGGMLWYNAIESKFQEKNLDVGQQKQWGNGFISSWLNHD